MEALGAIVFLPADEQASPLFLQKILFDPAALWLAHALKAEGVERFLVVCDNAHRDLAGDCFPADTLFVTTGSTDAPARLAEFLASVPGQVTVVTRPVLLAPQGTQFDLPPREVGKSVFTLKGSALAAALQDGRSFDEALSALGDTKPFQSRILPLKSDNAYRASTV